MKKWFKRLVVDMKNMEANVNEKGNLVIKPKGGAYVAMECEKDNLVVCSSNEDNIFEMNDLVRKIIKNWYDSIVPENKKEQKIYATIGKWLEDEKLFSNQKITRLEVSRGEYSSREWKEMCESYAPEMNSRMITLRECIIIIVYQTIIKEYLKCNLLGDKSKIVQTGEDSEFNSEFCLVMFNAENLKRGLEEEIIPFDYTESAIFKNFDTLVVVDA